MRKGRKKKKTHGQYFKGGFTSGGGGGLFVKAVQMNTHETNVNSADRLLIKARRV